nr:hypothetical protein [Bordetella genomosp. 5]
MLLALPPAPIVMVAFDPTVVCNAQPPLLTRVLNVLPLDVFDKVQLKIVPKTSALSSTRVSSERFVNRGTVTSASAAAPRVIPNTPARAAAAAVLRTDFDALPRRGPISLVTTHAARTTLQITR